MRHGGWRRADNAPIAHPISRRRLSIVRPRIHPSILSADFVNLEHEVGRIGNADAMHVDVMDNHFVPNLTFGQPMVERLLEVTTLPLDVHLMIDDPDRWAPGLRLGGGRFGDLPRGGGRGSDPRSPARSARRVPSSGSRSSPVRRWSRGCRHRRVRHVPDHDRRARLRRAVVHERDDAQAAAPGRRGRGRRQRSAAPGGRRDQHGHHPHRGVERREHLRRRIGRLRLDDPNAAIEALRLAATPSRDAEPEPEDG